MLNVGKTVAVNELQKLFVRFLFGVKRSGDKLNGNLVAVLYVGLAVYRAACERAVNGHIVIASVGNDIVC